MVALFWVALVLSTAVAMATSRHQALRWQPETRSPQRGFGAESEALYRSCGAVDLGLVRVAGRVVARRVGGRSPLSAQQLKEMGQVEGVPQPWLRAWSLQGRFGPKELQKRLRTWLGPTRGQARCGVARGVAATGEPVVAAVVVDALADLAPMARRVRRFAWISLQARLHVPAQSAKVILLGPRGEPTSVLASMTAGRVRSRFRLDRPGRWLVQLLAFGPSGPLPVAEAAVFVDRAPPKQLPAEGPKKSTRHIAPSAKLFRLLNRDRVAEGRQTLRRSQALDAVARLHAKQMLRAGRVAHDLGKGGPHQRVAAAGIRVQLLGENVAKARSVEAVHRALWSSPSHRKNMLATVYQQVGLAVLRDPSGNRWAVQLFAR